MTPAYTAQSLCSVYTTSTHLERGGGEPALLHDLDLGPLVHKARDLRAVLQRRVRQLVLVRVASLYRVRQSSSASQR